MNLKMSVTLLVSLLSVSLIARDNAETKPYNQLTPKERQQRIAEVQRRRLHHYGDIISRPGSQRGCIMFINGQTEISDGIIKEHIRSLTKLTKLNIQLSNGDSNLKIGEVSDLKKSLKANVAIFIIHNKDIHSSLLVDPEDNWAVINICPLFKNAKNKAFMETRLRTEMSRAFFACAGAMNGQQNGSLMGAIRKPEDLDRLSENPPLDVVGRTINNLEQIGVTRLQLAPYLRACQQGWAPAPTNDIQKAIWDKVHAMPTAPIKIKPETKKVKE